MSRESPLDPLTRSIMPCRYIPEEARIEALIWSGYDLIPRLIRLCNRLKRSDQPDWFNVSEDNMETLEQPVAALELSSLSDNVRFSPGRISHFRAVISDLYMAIYESTMVRSATGTSASAIRLTKEEFAPFSSRRRTR